MSEREDRLECVETCGAMRSLGTRGRGCALESWRGVEGGEELVVEVTGEGALESWRGRRGDHLPTERTCGAVGEPSVDAWRVEGVHAWEEEVARGGGRS